MTLHAVESPAAHRLGIKADDVLGRTAMLTLDGAPLRGVKSLTLRMGVDDSTTVTLELDCEVDADVLALIA